MLQTLAMRGYRSFESYHLTNLARVNLIVGKNSTGKTSILEAIELLVSGGNPNAFYDSARRRGELGPSGRVRERALDISHIFFGHMCVPGVRFDLSSDDGGRALSIKILLPDEVGEGAEEWGRRRSRWSQQGLFDPDETSRPVFGLSIDRGAPEKTIVLPIMEDGTLLFERHPEWIRNGPPGTPVHFLTLESFGTVHMGEMWNAVLTEGREAEIVDDMKILEPDLDSIHFLMSSGYGSRILLGRRNGGKRLPIGTYGDGMRRLLALRLSFVGTANGFLLIDEIDTGLHWTIMEDMWQFIVEVGRKANVQIFATTHSYDCIRGLASLLETQPHLTDEVSIQKVDSSLKQAVCLRGEQIRVAVAHDIEVR